MHLPIHREVLNSLTEMSVFSLHAKALQLCPTLCHSINCSLTGSCVLGILQARILKCIAMSSSRGFSPHRDGIHLSYVSCIGRRVLYPVPPGKLDYSLINSHLSRFLLPKLQYIPALPLLQVSLLVLSERLSVGLKSAKWFSTFRLCRVCFLFLFFFSVDTFKSQIPACSILFPQVAHKPQLPNLSLGLICLVNPLNAGS